MSSAQSPVTPYDVNPKTTAGFVLALLFLLLATVAAQLQMSNLAFSSHMVWHTHNVLEEIENALSLLREAESGQRGFLISGDQADVSAYQGALAGLEPTLDHLRQLTADNPVQQRHLDDLVQLVGQRKELLLHGASVRQGRGLQAALAWERSSDSARIMRDIDRITGAMGQEEERLLQQRDGQFQARARMTGWLIAAANGLLLALLLGGLLAIKRAARRRRQAEEQLQDAHAGQERRVAERTAALATANRALEAEVRRRRQSEEKALRLAAIVESSDDAIIGESLEGAVLSWNGGAERLYGYAPEEVIGRPSSILLPPEQTDEGIMIRERIRRGEHIDPFETVRKRKDGRSVDVLMTVSAIADGSGRIVAASIVARDITERKRLEQQYRQAQKMEAIGRLAGGVAHDFNNVLTIISGYSELLLARAETQGGGRDHLLEISKASERAAGLVRQLLAFSRQQVLVPQVIDLNQLLRETERMLRRLIGEDIELASTLEPGLASVKVDPGQTIQVLMNLAVNARDAMPQGGRLTLETAIVYLDESYARTRAELRTGRYVMLAVSDTGHGMDANTKARIFEPFFTTKETGKGTGLGLSTVYGIVKQSGGHILVYSEPGRGTTFKIYLPPADGAPVQEAPPRAAKLSSSRRETILVVEDEDAVRALALHVLQGRGYRVLEASNGVQAVQVAQQYREPIHLLVTDVVMPRMGGRELACKLAHIHAETKVLYLSGYTDDAVVRHGFVEAQSKFLQKPFPPEALAQKVREILDAAEASTGAPANGAN